MVAPYVSLWARLVLRKRKPRIIGITGSVGKTTTTYMIAHVLQHELVRRRLGPVGFSSENMNDDTGLPLAVLRVGWLPFSWLPFSAFRRPLHLLLLPLKTARQLFSPDYPKTLVLEYGTHWHGHLHRLAKLAPPDIAIVTTIGPAHLARLRTLEGVVKEKSALVRAAPSSGLVVLGSGHDYVDELKRQSRAPVVIVEGRGVELSRNITRAVCRHLGIDDVIVEEALAGFKQLPQRLQISQLRTMTVIDDSQNASPLSMKLALDILADTAVEGQRRVAVLGQMSELGDESASYHAEIGAYARERSDLLIGVGDGARAYNPNHWFPSASACVEAIETVVLSHDCILVKGSNSVNMVKVANWLRDEVPA